MRVWAVGFFQEAAFFLMINFPGRLADLGLAEGGIGILYSASAVAALALRPAFGRILDVVHRRSVLKVAGIANVAATLALAVIDGSGATLWVVFLTQRILQIVLFTTILTYAADSLPREQRTHGLALFGLSGLIPIAAGGLTADLLIGWGGYPALLMAAAASGLVGWLIVWRLPLLPVMGRRPRRSFWAVLHQPDLRPLWWVSLMFGIGMETLFTFMRTYVDTRRTGSLGLFFGIYGALAVGTRLFGGSHYDRVPHRGVTVGAVAVLGLSLVLLGGTSHLAVFVVAAAVGGAAHGAVFPILSSQVVTRSRTAERGSAVAIFTSIFDVALLAAAPLVGALIDGIGYGVAFPAAGSVLMGGALVYAVWDRRLVQALATS